MAGDKTDGSQKRMLKSEARRLSEEDLVNRLVTDSSNGQVLRDEAIRRMAEDGYSTWHAWITAPCVDESRKLRRQVSVLEKRVREMEGDRPLVRWSSKDEPFELATKMLNSGWRGQGMREPSTIRPRLIVARDSRLSWAGLDSKPKDVRDGARRFWEAAEYYWQLWMAAEEDAD